MTEMILKMARAIDWAPFSRQDENWRGQDSPLWEHYHRTDVTRIASAKNRARDVIKAMRSPTDEMAREGFDVVFGNGSVRCREDCLHTIVVETTIGKEVWFAMIAIALNKGAP